MGAAGNGGMRKSLGDAMPEHYGSDDWRKTMEEAVLEIRKDLYIGNGRPGMTYRMASVEKDI